jgi:hypothetical protein
MPLRQNSNLLIKRRLSMNKNERTKRIENVLAAWATARNNGVGQAEFASAAGISDRTLRQWVADHDASPDRMTKLIADAHAAAARLHRAIGTTNQAATRTPPATTAFVWE